MGEPIRPERGAKPGKFCVWVEPTSGAAFRHDDEFETEQSARDFAAAAAKELEMKGVNRIIVYDDSGLFKYMLTRRD